MRSLARQPAYLLLIGLLLIAQQGWLLHAVDHPFHDASHPIKSAEHCHQNTASLAQTQAHASHGEELPPKNEESFCETFLAQAQTDHQVVALTASTLTSASSNLIRADAKHRPSYYTLAFHARAPPQTL